MRRLLLPCLLLAASTGCSFDPAGVSAETDASGKLPTDADSMQVDAALAEIDATPPLLPDAAVADAMPPAPDARVCPNSYTIDPVTGHAYRLRRMRRSWPDAQAACESTGTGIHLVVIDDAAELQAIDALVDVPAAWIGVNDLATEDAFVTVTGAPATFLPWDMGEPNDSMDEDCVEILGAVFNDRDCADTRPFVCECE